MHCLTHTHTHTHTHTYTHTHTHTDRQSQERFHPSNRPRRKFIVLFLTYLFTPSVLVSPFPSSHTDHATSDQTTATDRHHMSAAARQLNAMFSEAMCVVSPSSLRGLSMQLPDVRPNPFCVYGLNELSSISVRQRASPALCLIRTQFLQ